MTTLFQAAQKEQAKKSPAYTRTENGALTLASSGTKVLDLFARGAAMRHSTEAEIEKLFSEAYKEDKILAVTLLFYIRDVLHGQGERRFFRVGLRWLANKNAKLVSLLLPIIPEYGRWDDLFVLKGIANKGESLYQKVLQQYATQLMADAAKCRLEGESTSISLAAKWAPSEKSKLKDVAFDLMRTMGVSARQYRKLLSFLREHLQIVERFMCAKDFSEIRYESVPSRAAMLYRKAFKKQDGARYLKYLEQVESGAKNIKAGTLFPYEIVSRLRNMSGTDTTLELQWKALPEYPAKGLAVVDGSGSMYSNYMGGSNSVIPIDVALSIGLYLAEHNQGIWEGKLITFSENPKFIELPKSAKTLKDKIQYVKKYDEIANTNIQKVFDMILALAQKHNLPESEMPEILYIISDMEFDSCVSTSSGYGRSFDETNLEAMTRKYEAAGYKRPKIVFWNVQSRNAQSPAAFDERGVALFSGCSPSLFKTALEGELNPVKAMLTTIDVPRYHPIMELVASV